MVRSLSVASVDGEVGGDRAGVAFRHRDVVDRDPGVVVVQDRAGAHAVGDARIHRVGEVDGVGLVEFIERVADRA